jgi:hypothetical protein
MVEESSAVFDSYYRVHPNIKIVRAYLSYSAYSYLVRNIELKTNIFQCMEIEMDQMEKGRDICSMAMLKYLSVHFNAQYEPWICREVRRFISRGVILPCFKSFMNLTDIPGELADRVFAVYTSNPAHMVKVKYRIDSGRKNGVWKEENMQNVYGGIFVKAWPLFAGEKLTWQVLDDDGEDITVTDTQELVQSMDGNQPLVSGIDYINRMILQKDFNDYDALYRTAKSYSRIKAVAESAFDIL